MSRALSIADIQVKTQQVLNDHPDCQTLPPSYDYNDIATDFPPDTWLKPADLNVNVSWNDTGSNPVATIGAWNPSSAPAVTTKGSYPAVSMTAGSSGSFAINLNGNARDSKTQSWTMVCHIEGMADLSDSVRLLGVSNVLLSPQYDNLFSDNPLFGFIPGLPSHAGKVGNYYFFPPGGPLGTIGAIPITADSLLTAEGTSLIYRWEHATKELTVVFCDTGAFVKVALPGWLPTLPNDVAFLGTTTPSNIGCRFTDFAWWTRALNDTELTNLQLGFCGRYNTVTGGPTDKQVLSYSGVDSFFRPKSLNATDIVGFDTSARFATGYVQNNFSAVVDPTNTDGATLSYAVGSMWVNVNTDTAFICVDSTGPAAAIWKTIT